MTAPAALLAQARAAGLTFATPEPGALKLIGDPAAVARWTPILRPHKAALLSILTDPPTLTREDLGDVAEAIQERASIQEFDGHIPRLEAERLAKARMRVYRVKVRMPTGNSGEPKWVVMLLPGVETLDRAREAAEWRFGAERVIEVTP